MAMQVQDVLEWLATFDRHSLVGIGEGGLCLTINANEDDSPDGYLEVGGWPLDDVADVDVCSTCHGEPIDNPRDLLGTETCPDCAGTGKVQP